MSMPSKSENLINYYGKDLEAMDLAVNYHNWILDKFTPFVGKKILEVGAGSGSLTEMLVKRFDADIVSLEPSLQMYPLLREKAQYHSSDNRKIQTYNSYLVDKVEDLKKENIDTIVYVNVMEHVPDDILELQLIKSILPKNGHLLTFSPAMPFLMSDFDRSIGHHRRYTKKEMLTKLGQVGLTNLDTYYMDGPGVIPWYVLFTLLKKNLTAGSTALYDSAVVPILKIFEPSKYLPFGKNLLSISGNY
jgi:SAM-dependent methyltransferase